MKTLKILAFVFALPIVNSTKAANEIAVLETTFKPSSSEGTEYFFGFAKGDQIVITLEVIKGRPVKEFTFSEYEGATRFSEIKTTGFTNKAVNISSTGIFRFKIRGSLGTGKCKLTINRIPSDFESESFNTTVYWRSMNDTTFYTVKERFLVSKDTVVVNLMDRIEKVHSTLNPQGNKNTFNFTLPANTSSWSYYIGVNQAGQKAYEQATSDLTKYAAPLVAKIPGYGPLAALALGGVSYLSKLQGKEDVDYYIVDNGQEHNFSNGSNFTYLKKGKVVNDYAQMAKRSGILHFCLKNDNAFSAIEVFVKVTAITITENWELREVEKFKVADRDEPYLKN